MHNDFNVFCSDGREDYPTNEEVAYILGKSKRKVKVKSVSVRLSIIMTFFHIYYLQKSLKEKSLKNCLRHIRPFLVQP